MLVWHGVRMRYACNLPECGEYLGQPLRPVVHHDHTLACVTVRPPQIIALVSANGAALGDAVLRTKKIDGPGLPVVLREDGGPGADVWCQTVVRSRDRRRHLLPAELIGKQLRQRSEPVIFDTRLL